MINSIKKLYKKMYYSSLRKKGIKMGKNCDINKRTIFGTEPYLISLGDNVRISSNVRFINHDGGIWVLRNLNKVPKNADKIGTIKIGNNVSIGMNVIIMPNVIIGDNVIIGAGAIVTKNIPSNSIAAGVPAKVIESLDEYEKKVSKIFLETKYLNSKEKKQYLISYFKNFENEKY